MDNAFNPAGRAPALALSLAGLPAAADAVPASQFTGTMSTLAASVTIVTAATDTERHGRTVTALLSLGVEPPSLLVSITRDTALAETILKAGRFSLAVLAADQRRTADSFAGLGPHEDRFAVGDWTAWPSGQPRLEGALANLDCTLAGVIETDTHLLFVGIVTHTQTFPERQPLLWHRRGYAQVDAG